MLFLDLNPMKVFKVQKVYLEERKGAITYGFDNIEENGAFAHHEQMLHFP